MTWSGGYGGPANCATDGNGRCTVSTGNIWKRNRKATFAVSDVTHSTFTYAPAGNHDPDGDSDGTSITVTRP